MMSVWVLILTAKDGIRKSLWIFRLLTYQVALAAMWLHLDCTNCNSLTWVFSVDNRSGIRIPSWERKELRLEQHTFPHGQCSLRVQEGKTYSIVEPSFPVPAWCSPTRSALHQGWYQGTVQFQHINWLSEKLDWPGPLDPSHNLIKEYRSLPASELIQCEILPFS
jgi:hypothetical protein